MEDRLFYCGVSLLSACSWALGAILWRRLGEHLSSYSMNLGKVVLGSICLGFILLLIGFEPVSSRSIVLLGLSGILGIAVGDTFFFLSLMRLGPRRASLMGSLNPVAIAVAAAIFLGERPSYEAWAGIAVTTLGVSWVLWERTPAGSASQDTSLGIRYGFLSVVCTAGAVLLAKAGVVSAPTAQAAWIRLLAGSVGLILWGVSSSKLGEWVGPFRKKAILARVSAVVAVVVIGGFWLSIVALKHIDASIAGSLNSTSPLFILPLSSIILKEKISPRTIFGTAVAVGGVVLILMG